MNDHISVTGQDGTFAAYIARPKTSPAPAVLVLQELFGVNADIRKTCDELAEEGFMAVAPDLFWRQEPGVDLNVTSEADWQHGLRLYGAYDRDAGAKDVKDTVNAVRNLPECNGRVAVLGYCLGALMVFLTAVRYHGVDAAVAYHGGDTEKYLRKVDGLNAQMRGGRSMKRTQWVVRACANWPRDSVLPLALFSAASSRTKGLPYSRCYPFE
jgi:carboxymethylenebutenolidase